jgi:hypothetical protein
MKKNHFLCCGVAVLTAAGLCAAALAGCSGDSSPSEPTDAGHTDATTDGSSSVPDGQAHDTGTSPESSTPADTGTPPDTGTPETGTPEAGMPEAGGNDGGEAGADSGPDATVSDAGGDAGDAGGQADASDASGDDASEGGTADAGSDSGLSLNNPVQIDVSGILNANTVVTTAKGGTALTPMDGAGNNNDFPTQNEAIALNATMGVGLPNDGHFASNGSTIPDLQLAWSDKVNNLNSIVVAGNAGTKFQFNVPPAQYDHLQIYATGGNGGSTLTYTLTYTTGSATTATVSIPDWCGGPGTGEYTLASVYRVSGGNTLDTGIKCGIYAIDLTLDTTRTLTQVQFSDSAPSNTNLVFYGATAW